MRGPLRIAFGQVDLPLKPPPGRAELAKQVRRGGIAGWNAKRMLEVLDRGLSRPLAVCGDHILYRFVRTQAEAR